MFIRDNKEAILSDWEQFADDLTPSQRNLTSEELRDFAGPLLDSIIHALESGRNDPAETPAGDVAVTPYLAISSVAHASDRLTQRSR